MRTRTRNTPVPAGPRAPVDLHWLWYVGPPAGITAAYRAIPPRVRRWWNLRGGSTSHIALACILAGHGWRAFFTFARPYPRVNAVEWWTGGPLTFPAWVSPHMGLLWQLPPFGPEGNDPNGMKWKLELGELPDWFPTTSATARMLQKPGKRGWYVNG